MWTKKAAGHLMFAVLCLLLALVTGSLGLAVVGLFFAAAVVVGFLVRRSASVRHARTLGADRVREEDHAQVSLELTGAGLGTGFVEVRDRLDAKLDVVGGTNYRIVSLGRGKSTTMDYELETPVRGVYGIGPVDLRKTDLYELFYTVRSVPESVDGLTVLPRSAEIKDAKIKSLTPKIISGLNPVRQPGIGSDFYALREYTSADPMRDVNWKASARKGELIVNQWERESITVLTMVLDVREVTANGQMAANPLLFNTRAAATFLDYFTAERSTIRFVTYGDAVHSIQPDSGERQLYKVLERLAAVEAEGNLPFIEVAQELLPKLSPKSPLILFTSLEDDPTVYDGLSLLMARELNVLVVVPSAPDFLVDAEPRPVDKQSYRLQRTRHQMEVKRIRGLGCRVVLWNPDDRLEIALMEAI